MKSVGIIANPASGKDIRRLISQSRLVTNQEKINIVKRILGGLEAGGIDKVLFMPDYSNEGSKIHCQPLMPACF